MFVDRLWLRFLEVVATSSTGFVSHEVGAAKTQTKMPMKGKNKGHRHKKQEPDGIHKKNVEYEGKQDSTPPFSFFVPSPVP